MTGLNALQKSILEQRPLEPIVLSESISLDELPTPALTIDLEIFETNLKRMQAHVDANGLALRSHTKMHKCPHIAKQQIAAGALGVCCAKVSEAEVMVRGHHECVDYVTCA